MDSACLEFRYLSTDGTDEIVAGESGRLPEMAPTQLLHVHFHHQAVGLDVRAVRRGLATAAAGHGGDGRRPLGGGDCDRELLLLAGDGADADGGAVEGDGELLDAELGGLVVHGAEDGSGVVGGVGDGELGIPAAALVEELPLETGALASLDGVVASVEVGAGVAIGAAVPVRRLEACVGGGSDGEGGSGAGGSVEAEGVGEGIDIGVRG